MTEKPHIIEETPFVKAQRAKNDGKLPAQMQHMTKLTRIGMLDMQNKCFRRGAMAKIHARRAAVLQMPDKSGHYPLSVERFARGTWHCVMV